MEAAIGRRQFKPEVLSSLERESKACALAIEYYQEMREGLEKKYEISSDEFRKRFEEGSMGDEQDFFDWYAYNRFIDSWQQTKEALEELIKWQ